MHELPQWLFDVYALALPRGHGFGNRAPIGAWGTEDGLSCGVITENDGAADFGVLVMRRRIDNVWAVIASEQRLQSQADAFERLSVLVRNGEAAEPLPPGVPFRPALYDLQDRKAGDVFNLLTGHSHHPAAWMLNQLYLALPNPDKNWAADCQTVNFHTRLWEAQLLASFREQGLSVTQPFESPDFRIENRRGGEAWVEAVTANPPIPYSHVNARQSSPPQTREEIFFGPAALRFAKTLGNKLTRRYDLMPHVKGKPFMIALADFQAPASMLWSREGLIGYLYGQGAEVKEIDGQPRAVETSASHLLGPSAFPAGLFANDQHSELSAIIFSNACSIAKFNRVAISGGGAPQGLRYFRIGRFYDRTPGALEGVPFCLDVTGPEYRSLWSQGYEPWCAEVEVFHNAHAKHPVPFELLPEATHWFDQDGEMMCRAIYEHAILWSQTRIQNDTDPAPRLEDFVPSGGNDCESD